ncbi:hypothetical protein GW17_00025396 [Ensete ventricosum]|nr:hypothetical protein GW17_00025396 [Ensete ventricosum]RZS25239.1 hypothetical protein BHM03_00058415 [Ensete ventricosum]
MGATVAVVDAEEVEVPSGSPTCTSDEVGADGDSVLHLPPPAANGHHPILRGPQMRKLRVARPLRHHFQPRALGDLQAGYRAGATKSLPLPVHLLRQSQRFCAGDELEPAAHPARPVRGRAARAGGGQRLRLCHDVATDLCHVEIGTKPKRVSGRGAPLVFLKGGGRVLGKEEGINHRRSTAVAAGVAQRQEKKQLSLPGGNCPCPAGPAAPDRHLPSVTVAVGARGRVVAAPRAAAGRVGCRATPGRVRSLASDLIVSRNDTLFVDPRSEPRVITSTAQRKDATSCVVCPFPRLRELIYYYSINCSLIMRLR